MPFTPAHMAVVFPLVNSRFFSATGLIIGSMAPDFEYFFKMSVNGEHGHTWAGLFYFDLPVTFVLSLIYHQVVKKNFILNLPAFMQRRFAEAFFFDFKNGLRKRWIVFVVSALLGSATHIVWDGFTHGDGFFVDYFSFYDGAFVRFQGVNYPLWYALQHISTFVGLLIVGVAILVKQKNDYILSKVNISYWASFFSIGVAVVALRFLIHSKDFNEGNLVVSSITAICVAMILCGLFNFSKDLSTVRN